jgi:hypothetical protein
MASMTATAATEFTAVRQHGGNSKDVSSSRSTVAYVASRLTPVVESVVENEVYGLVTDEIGFPEPYRYSVSSLTERSSSR